MLIYLSRYNAKFTTSTYLGYGVILEMKVDSARAKPGLPNQLKTVLVPTILNETSTILQNESTPISSTSLPEIVDSAAVKITKNAPESVVSQKTESKEVNTKPQALKVIPYNEDVVTFPFKQEKENGNLPLVTQSPTGSQSFGDKVLTDIAAQNGQQQTAKDNRTDNVVKEVQVSTSKQMQNVTGSIPQPSVNQSVLQNPDIFVTTAFDIFMTWNPRMTDPTFPPRLHVIKLLNEAVSNSYL